MKELVQILSTGDINWLGLSNENLANRLTLLNSEYLEFNPDDGDFDYSEYTLNKSKVTVTMQDQRIFNAIALEGDDLLAKQIFLVPKISIHSLTKSDIKLLDSENIFILNANDKTLHFMYFGCVYSYDLNDGDVGDYWNALHKTDAVYDINFSWEYDDLESIPALGIYSVEDGSTHKEVRSMENFVIYGDPDKIFNANWFLDDLSPGSIVYNQLHHREETVQDVDPDINKSYRIVTDKGHYSVKGFKVAGRGEVPEIIKTTKCILRKDLPCPKCGTRDKEDLVWFNQRDKTVGLLEYELINLIQDNNGSISRCAKCGHLYKAN